MYPENHSLGLGLELGTRNWFDKQRSYAWFYTFRSSISRFMLQLENAHFVLKSSKGIGAFGLIDIVMRNWLHV